MRRRSGSRSCGAAQGTSPRCRTSDYRRQCWLSTVRRARTCGFKHAAEQWFDDSMERVSGWYRRKVQLCSSFSRLIVVVFLNADTLTTARVLWRDDATRASIVARAEAAAKARPATSRSTRRSRISMSHSAGTSRSVTGRLSFRTTRWPGWRSSSGFALTIGAVMLGAPFWFDLLSKVSRVRATGAPPPASDSIRSGDGEQSRAGPGAAKATRPS